MENSLNAAKILAIPDILDCKRALCIQPHADDNEIGMGGIIGVLADRGCEIHYLTVTNGDKGNLNPDATREETAAVRREEACKAGRHLGAVGFHFLDYADGELADVLELSVKITEIIRKLEPDVLFCPDPWLAYECHLDHIVTGKAVSNAFHMSGRNHFPDGLKPWRATAIGYYFTSNHNTVIDVTGTFVRRFEAIAMHESQINPQTLAMYRMYFEMKASELAQGKDFALGEGLKVLGQLHTHCFVDAYKM